MSKLHTLEHLNNLAERDPDESVWNELIETFEALEPAIRTAEAIPLLGAKLCDWPSTLKRVDFSTLQRTASTPLAEHLLQVCSYAHLYIGYSGPCMGGKIQSFNHIFQAMDPHFRFGYELYSPEDAYGSVRKFSLATTPLLRLIHDVKVVIHLEHYQSNLTHDPYRAVWHRIPNGMVFVADSEDVWIPLSVRHWQILCEARPDLQDAIEDKCTPLRAVVLQFNKRNHPNAVEIEKLRAKFDPSQLLPWVESCSNEPGAPGVLDALVRCVRSCTKPWEAFDSGN